MICPLCERDCPPGIMEAHHLQTRRVDKKDTELICTDCHKAIHGLYDNTALRDHKRNLYTLEGLIEDERFYKALRFIKKQVPGAYNRMRQSKQRR